MWTFFERVSGKAVEPNELFLTSKGINSVNFDSSNSDFEFIFGEDSVCRVDSVLAEFLSPKVARLRRCDISFHVYRFKYSEVFDVFESLVSSLRRGEACRVERSNFLAFLCLSQDLENGELLSSLLGMIRTEFLTLEEVVFLFLVGIGLGAAFSARFEDLRDLVASHFHEIDNETLHDLDLEAAHLLLSSPSLRIEDEDSLYDFVRSRADTDLNFMSLFEFVHFECLSVDRIEDFASIVSEALLENINSVIWRQICRRLILKANPNEDNPRCIAIRFPCSDSKKLNGIIAHLTRECGGNVHCKGIVNLTASSICGDCHPKNVVDFKTDLCYCSENTRNSWICYDFKDHCVIPTSYSLRSDYAPRDLPADSDSDNEMIAISRRDSYGPRRHHRWSWVIEVSNDGTESSWEEIDRRENNDDFRMTVNFKISRVPSQSFRFFRIREIAGWNGNNHLVLTALEIFGTLFRK